MPFNKNNNVRNNRTLKGGLSTSDNGSSTFIPVHRDIPANESEYIAQAMPNGRLPCRQDEHIKLMHSKGITVDVICIRLGVRPESVFKLLGLDVSSKEFDETTKAIQARKKL